MRPDRRGSGRIERVIVRLTAAGAVVQDPDDLAGVHLQTDLDADRLRVALATTGTGELVDDGTALLDLAVLRSLAVLSPTAPDWPSRWAAMIDRAEREGMVSADRRSIRVPVDGSARPNT
jgi:hypothetical protein